MVVAGIAAPAVGVLVAPVLVAPAGGESYFTKFIGAARSQTVAEIESAARMQCVAAALCVALAFGIASVFLPRPGAARR
jgi:Na+-driven multidrug efflux pump